MPSLTDSEFWPGARHRSAVDTLYPQRLQPSQAAPYRHAERLPGGFAQLNGMLRHLRHRQPFRQSDRCS